jgi:hypothetical protein
MHNWGWRQWNREKLSGRDWIEFKGGKNDFPSQLHRRLVAIKDRVYVTLGYREPISVLDAATGEKIKVIKGTEGTEEIIYSGGKLILIVNKESKKNKINYGSRCIFR